VFIKDKETNATKWLSKEAQQRNEDATREYPYGWSVFDPKTGKELDSTRVKNNHSI